MAKYTTQVRTICEVNAGLTESVGFNDIDEVIEKAIPNIFNFDFPLFDESYKNVLCSKILIEYYTREIAFETVGLWKLKLRAKLNKIMPYYNQLYKSALLDFNPFYDVDLEKTYNRTGSENQFGNSYNDTIENGSNLANIQISNTKQGTNEQESAETGKTSNKGENTSKSVTNDKGTSTSTSNETVEKENNKKETQDTDTEKINRYSDTPQGMVADIKNNKYLTNVSIDNATDKTKIESKITDLQESEQLDTTEDKRDTTNTLTQENENTIDTTIRSNDETSYRETQTGSNNTNSSTNKTVNVTNTNNNNVSSLEDYIETVKGKNGGKSYSLLLKEFRETFLNVDNMVLDELADLFFTLW